MRSSDLPGGPHSVDPLALLTKAREVAGLPAEVSLRAVAVTHVGASGLVDLAPDRGRSSIKFLFLAETPLPGRGDATRVAPDAASLATTRTVEGRTLYTVDVLSDGMHAASKQELGGHVLVSAPPPRCSLRRLWEAAIRAGAPRDALAVIAYESYETTRATPERPASSHQGWVFTIEGTRFTWKMSDGVCEIEHKETPGQRGDL